MKGKQKEYCKKYYANNKEQVITQQREKIACNICNSLITRNKMIRHQQTDICKKKALILNNSHIDKDTQLKETQKEYNKIHYESNKEKVISQHGENIPCNICNALITRDKINRPQLTSD